jgi:putative oxidoreductase
MRYVVAFVGAALGCLFVYAAVMVLFDLAGEQPPPPEGSAVAHFFGAFGPTGYLTFVKVLELAGGVLVAIPRTRCLGLLVLGPIVVNILAFHAFVAKDGLLQPMLLAIAGMSLFLLLAEWRAFSFLLTRPLPFHAPRA